MQTKKIICFLIISLFIVSLIVPIVSAKEEETGRVWRIISNIMKQIKKIWEAINKLQKQVNELGEKIDILNKCPSNMVRINGYCIDKDENPQNSWFEQAELCASENKRLCSPSEWYGACKGSTDELNIELNDMTNNGEWVDDFHLSYAAYVMGNGACEVVQGAQREDNTHTARCCR